MTILSVSLSPLWSSNCHPLTDFCPGPGKGMVRVNKAVQILFDIMMRI